MKGITIRKARRSDLSTIKSLVLELVESMDNTKGVDASHTPGNYIAALKNSNSHLLVAEIGKVVGFIHFTTRRTVLHKRPSGLIDEVVVSKDYRRKGVGRKLLSAAIEKCRQLGCCEIEVSTELANREAIEFYRGFGFEERGLLLEMDIE